MERFGGFTRDYEVEVFIFRQMVKYGYDGPIPTTGCNLPDCGEAPPIKADAAYQRRWRAKQKLLKARSAA